MSAEAESREMITPWPPRYWWLKRIVMALVAFVVAVAVFRLSWGWNIHRQLEAKLEAYRQRGDPMTWAELKPPMIPDAENGAIYLQQAIGALSTRVDSPSASNFDFPSYLPMPPEWMSMEEKALAANAQALKLAREARSHPNVVWPIAGDPLDFNTLQLGKTRSLANSLVDAALYHHLTGDDREALEAIQDTLYLARALATTPTAVGQLVAAGIGNLAASHVGMIAPRLSLRALDGKQPATREQMQALLQLLLEDDLARRWERALFSERAILFAVAGRFKQAHWTLEPVFARKELQALDAVDSAMEMVRGEQVPPIPERLGSTRLAVLSATPVAATPTEYLENTEWGDRSTYIQLLIAGRMGLTQRRAAAIAVAARLYQVDHEGRWPDSLETLVPQYLPTIPIDPLSLDRKPFRYLRVEGGKRPIVVGVGQDRTESVSERSILPNHPVHEFSSTLLDFVWDLSSFDPATPFAPSTPYAETQRLMDSLKQPPGSDSISGQQPGNANQERQAPTRQQQ